MGLKIGESSNGGTDNGLRLHKYIFISLCVGLIITDSISLAFSYGLMKKSLEEYNETASIKLTPEEMQIALDYAMTVLKISVGIGFVFIVLGAIGAYIENQCLVLTYAILATMGMVFSVY